MTTTNTDEELLAAFDRNMLSIEAVEPAASGTATITYSRYTGDDLVGWITHDETGFSVYNRSDITLCEYGSFVDALGAIHKMIPCANFNMTSFIVWCESANIDWLA